MTTCGTDSRAADHVDLRRRRLPARRARPPSTPAPEPSGAAAGCARALGAATGLPLREGEPGPPGRRGGELRRSAPRPGNCAPEGYRITVRDRRTRRHRRRPGRGVLGRPDAAAAARPRRLPARTRRRRTGWELPVTRRSQDAPRFAWRGLHARRRPALHAQGRRPALSRPAGRPQAQRPAPAPHRRPGLADRDQALPEAHGDRIAGGRAPSSATAPAAVGRAPARRLLHPGRHPRDRRLRRRPAYHRRPRDRHPRPLAGGHRRLSGTRQHRRRRHRPPSPSGTPGASTRTYSPPPTTSLRFYENVLRGSPRPLPRRHSSTSAATSAPRTSGRRRRPRRPGSRSSGLRGRGRAPVAGSSGTSTPGWPSAAVASSAGTRSWRAASPRAPPCPPGAATGAASPPRGRGTTSSCAPSSRSTWTTVSTAAPTSRCRSAIVRTLEDVYRFEPVPRELTSDRGAARPRHPGQHLDRGHGGPRARRLPGLPAARRLRRGRLVRPARPAERDFADFERRMTAHYGRLDALGVDYRPPTGPLPWQQRPGVLGRPIEGAPPNV